MIVGAGLVATGVIAVFISSNPAGTAALLALGGSVAFVATFGDRLLRLKMGGVEFELAKKVADQLRLAFDKRLRGSYELAEDDIRRAFDRFTEDLDGDERALYTTSTEYHKDVRTKLTRIVASRFGGSVQPTSSTNSFFPLIDVVLRLDGPEVHAALERRNLTLCPDLEMHLRNQLLVGVTIRPGPDLDVYLFAERLRTNVQNGALSATCFLLIQNCNRSQTGERFRALARQLGMHATSLEWAAGGTELELDKAVDDAILTMCSEASLISPAP
jgi:hypothetical protein